MNQKPPHEKPGEISELSRLIWYTDPTGEHPGSVEISRTDDGTLLARLWQEVSDGGHTDRTLAVGSDVLVTMQVPTGINAPSSRWATPSELADELIGPPPARIRPVSTPDPRRGREQAPDPAALALADDATAALRALPPIRDRPCPHCDGTGKAARECLCVTLGVGAGVVDLDHTSTPTGRPAPDCPTCDGTGSVTDRCWTCDGEGVLCAPYDLEIDLGPDGVFVVPGQPHALAALSGVTARSAPSSVWWTLSQAPVLDRMDLGGRELFSPSGYPVPWVSPAVSAVTVGATDPWPSAEELAAELAGPLATTLALRAERGMSPDVADRLGYLVDDNGMTRRWLLEAREPCDGVAELSALLDRAEPQGLQVMMTTGFIATGEFGPRVILSNPRSGRAWSSEPWHRLADAVRGAVLDWDRIAGSGP